MALAKSLAAARSQVAFGDASQQLVLAASIAPQVNVGRLHAHRMQERALVAFLW
jgi:hypothetical protein